MPFPLPEMVCSTTDGTWASVRILGIDYSAFPDDGKKTAAQWQAEYHAAGMLPLPDTVLQMTWLQPGELERMLASGEWELGDDLLGNTGPLTAGIPAGPPQVVRNGRLVEKGDAAERDTWQRKRRNGR